MGKSGLVLSNRQVEVGLSREAGIETKNRAKKDIWGLWLQQHSQELSVGEGAENNQSSEDTEYQTKECARYHWYGWGERGAERSNQKND